MKHKFNSDSFLLGNIKKLQSAIKLLAKKYKYKDYKFWSYLEYFNNEPEEMESCAAVMTCDGSMSFDLQVGASDSFASELNEAIEKVGFWYEYYNHYTLMFYSTDDQVSDKYGDLLYWQWVTSLIQPEYTSLHEELFNYFSDNPNKLYNVSPRQLEIYTGEIFRNQGYEVELGPGNNDGGIDLRLFQKNEIDQITTLVQIKRYKKQLPIRLDAVAALSGHIVDQNADQGLFITTSRYLPSAQAFAERQKKRITLANSDDLKKWSEIAGTNIGRDKSQLISDSYLLQCIQQVNSSLAKNKIVVSQPLAFPLYNTFALILKETRFAALLIILPVTQIETSDPPYNSRGFEVPIIDESLLTNKVKDKVIRAVVQISERGAKNYLARNYYFTVWDGNSARFDLND